MKNLLLLIATFYGLSLSAQSTCETATAISVGLHTVDTIMGQEPPLICANNGNPNPLEGEWFTYTADADYLVTLNTDLEQNANQDTRVHVYEGNCVDGFVCRGGDDDAGDEWGPYLTIAQFVVYAGETVYIVWDDRWDSNGFDFDLSVEEYIAPPEPPVSFTEESILGGGQKLGAVDMNGDYLDDIVAISNGEIRINYQTEEGFDFVNIGNETPAFLPSWSLTAGDIDHNGYNDLIFGGGQGVSFMYANEDGTAYTEVSGEEYVFCQRGNCVDINNDGQLDVFMCHDVQPNVFYINDGEGNLSFNQGGLGDVTNGGNYGSIWVDYDNDGDTDMFIAKCRGGNSDAKINELHRNNGDGTYTEVGEELALNDPVQTWSSAWGDFDNDGDFDIFIGASSFTDGGHKLLQNNGDGTFTDVTFGSGVADIEGSGIENITHDWDNDGYLDLLGMGGTFMAGNGDMTFTEYEIGPGNGPVGDLNNDGFLDIVSGNTLYMNEGNENNYLVVNTIGTASNLNGIGAMINIYTPNMNFMRQVRSGDGFRYMSSLNAYFGLGQESEIDSVMITWPSGMIDVYYDVEVNTVQTYVEGDSPLSAENIEEQIIDLLVYPNPASNVVFIDVPFPYAQMQYSIFDMSGKMVDIGVVNKNSINISELGTGAYIIRVDVDGKIAERKVVRE
jgi:hypothetical protein